MEENEKHWRTFVAVELSPELTEQLGAWQAALRGRMPAGVVRWTRPTGIHVTLKFLGDTPTTKLPALQEALRNAAFPIAPFTLRSAAYGCFPHCRRPRVLWLGLSGDLDVLQALWQAVEQHVAPLGWPTEKRPFAPHLTLGRINRHASPGAVSAVSKIMRTTPAPPRAQWKVESITFFRSTLRPSGAVYTTLGRFPLGNGKTN